MPDTSKRRLNSLFMEPTKRGEGVHVVAMSKNMPKRIFENPSRTEAEAAPEEVAITEIRLAQWHSGYRHRTTGPAPA